MSDPVHVLILDAQGVVVGHVLSNCPQPGGIEVDADTFARAVAGASRMVDGALQPYAPPAAQTEPPAICGDAIIGAISDAEAAKCRLRDLLRIAWRDDVPPTNNKLGRIADALGTTPDALRQAGAAST